MQSISVLSVHDAVPMRISPKMSHLTGSRENHRIGRRAVVSRRANSNTLHLSMRIACLIFSGGKGVA